MLQKILEFIRIAVGIGSIAGVFYLLSKFTKLDIWKRIAISVLAGLFIGAGFSDMTKTTAERQQETAQEAEKKLTQAQEQAKFEKEAKKSEKIAQKAKPLSKQERAEASDKEKLLKAKQEIGNLMEEVKRLCDDKFLRSFPGGPLTLSKDDYTFNLDENRGWIVMNTYEFSGNRGKYICAISTKGDPEHKKLAVTEFEYQ